MAVEIGTATDYLDLLSKFRIFVTGMGVNPWTVMRNTIGGTHAAPAGELILRAPGLAGTDQIFVGIQPFANATADYYDWRLGGFTGFNNALAWGAQPGIMQKVFMTLWDSPIPYWFVANGRRAIIVAKVSTFYMMGYLGFINQYASPNQYPYPLAIGGNYAIDPETAFTSTAWRWSNSFFTNSNFPMPTSWDPGGGVIRANTSTLRIRLPNGTWGFMRAGSNGVYQDLDDSTVWPYMAGMANLQSNLGADQSPVLPIILHDNTPEVYGELDGVYATSGQARASEDTITVGADTLLIVQNVMRTARNNYCAVKLA